MLTPDLYKAYLNTTYKVNDPPLSIHVNEYHPDLDLLLETHHCETWAFITASNPHSKALSKNENSRRHQLLLADLSKFKYFKGRGKGKESSWLPETSVLILNISLEESIKLGRKHEQNAIISGKRKGVAKLTILA